MNIDWIYCICIVDFDIGIGQVLEHVYPPSAVLTDTEKTNICYLAFPDSNSGCLGDTKFHISLRTNNQLTSHQRAYNRDCQQHLKADAGHYWGYVYFRQVKDARNARGYFQKSFVLVTRLPFHNFFYELILRWAPAYFESGLSALEQGCDQMKSWPRLTINTQLQLHVLGSIYQIYIPAAANRTGAESTVHPAESEDVQNNNNNSALIPISITSPNEIDIFGPLHTIIHHIQLMWELVMLCEPLVIIATSPTDSSHMVQALTSLIHPLEYHAEVYPYFTIHNTEFREFAAATNPPAVILGVTNPYFAKTLQSWPHTVRITEPLQIQHNSEHPLPHRKLERVRTLSKFLMDTSGSIYSQHKPFLAKDKSLIKRILNGVKTRRPTAVQSVILRRHFLELTQSFMIPLERYMSTLMPLAKDICAFRAPPVPAPFVQDTFLGTLDFLGPHLTSTVKGDYEGLYKRFFRSENFRGWYESRRMEQLEKLEALHLETIAKENLKKWIVGKQEVEIVDLILGIKQKLQIPVTSNSTLTPPEPTIHVTIKKDVKDQLMKQLDELMECLPSDLRQILN
jgi:Stabilization of polarity axis